MNDFDKLEKLRKRLARLDTNQLQSLRGSVDTLGRVLEPAADPGIFGDELPVSDVSTVYDNLARLVMSDDIEDVRQQFWRRAYDAGFERPRCSGAGAGVLDDDDASPPAVMLRRLIELRHPWLMIECANLIRHDGLYEWAVVGVEQFEGFAKPWVSADHMCFYYGVRYVLRLTRAGQEAAAQQESPCDVVDWWNYLECSLKPVKLPPSEVMYEATGAPYRDPQVPREQTPEVEMHPGRMTLMVEGKMLYPKSRTADIVMDALWRGDDKQEGREPPSVVVGPEYVRSAFHKAGF